MAYERQYYTNGDVLNAEQLNHMEAGIKENSDNIDKLSEEKVDKIGISLGKHTDGLVYIFIDGKPVGTGLDISSGEVTEKDWYVWYMSNIAPIDGLYNSHSYSNVYIVGNELIVLYRSAPHHFSDASLCKMRISRTNLTTFESTSEDLLDGLNYFGSVKCNDTYYIFDKSMYRYDTKDFKEFNKVAYTVPSGASEPYYITVGENDRFISTHSNSSKKGCMMYSDDYGLTWLQANGDDVYNATLTTHGATTKVGNTLVAYCQASKTDSPTNNDTVLNVLLSTDNGLTWSGAEVVNEDLKYCGPSFASGMFAQIGEEWFLCLSNRLQTTDENGNIHLGNVKLFKGSAEDVLNGTMSLYVVVDDFNTECTSSNVTGGVSMTDTGNIGMTTDGKNLYVVYAKPLMRQSTPQKEWITSNSMLCMAIVNSLSTDISRQDSYYDSEWESKRDSFVTAQNIEHNLYIYGDGDNVVTNVNGIDVYTRSNSGRLQSGHFCLSDDIAIPFDKYIDIRIVGQLGNRYVDGAYKEHYYGFNVDGKKYAICGIVNYSYFNKTNANNYACSLRGKFGDIIDYRLTYDDGKINVKWNGITIEDVKSYVVVDTSLNETEKTAFLTFKALATLILNKVDYGKQGFMALTIDTDGDISDLLGEIVVDPEIPIYSITNNLTNCKTSQTATEINEGSAYTTTITANDGYVLSEVICTMGGVEQTVTNGVITIDSVTGDIVITAIATKEVIVENPITDGLIHWLKVDDVSDTTWTDSVDSDTSFTVTGYDSELNLVETSGNINFGTSENIGINKEYTFDFVARMKSSGSLLMLSPGGNNYSQDVNIMQHLYNILREKHNYITLGENSSTRFKGKTAHVVVTKDSDGNYRIYFNGALEGSATNTTDTTASKQWTIVSDSSYLGDVRIYDRALTANEVINNYKYEQRSHTFDVIT